ncbi:Putative Mn2+ efflux pump MntP [Humidesulfovibrio mexicanus]|uniref:Putative manganese efflux pump MntP n=1 Tax=Humidesulfovibrio mexicanus TaxID=147047 RepID=A0A239BY26_9BACT|nr:manganese efflux pump MntP family protein [Humidesulfovibrio mexicanus]SNS12331.1 Putative Mn2+ efflux pump MntP [Humidesulfovibrio mexicanus]
MPFATLLAIAVALAMDAFAVALATGICLGRVRPGHVLRMAGAFGLFQALMPVAGWLLGFSVRGRIEAFDHWLAFALLAFVGGKMIWEGLTQTPDDPGCEPVDRTRGWPLLVLAVATSVDALAVGLSFAMLGQGILVPALVIGVVCFAITALGLRIGCMARRVAAIGRYAELLGGAVLLAIGLRILLEHGALSFA